MTPVEPHDGKLVLTQVFSDKVFVDAYIDGQLFIRRQLILVTEFLDTLFPDRRVGEEATVSVGTIYAAMGLISS